MEAAKQSRPAIGLYLSEVPNNWQGKCMGNMETLLAFLRRQNNNTEQIDFTAPFYALGASGAEAENVEYAGSAGSIR
jgi:hypothetical protein